MYARLQRGGWQQYETQASEPTRGKKLLCSCSHERMKTSTSRSPSYEACGILDRWVGKVRRWWIEVSGAMRRKSADLTMLRMCWYHTGVTRMRHAPEALFNKCAPACPHASR